MTRLSRALNPSKRELNPSKREGKPAEDAAPLEVRVTAGDGDRPQGSAGVWIGGAPIEVAPGQEPQDAVLAHLCRRARAGGRSVLATIHDERIGYVVPLRVDPDGSSHLTSKPVRSGATAAQGPAATGRTPERRREPAAGRPVSAVERSEPVAERSEPESRPGPGQEPDRRTQILRLPSVPAEPPRSPQLPKVPEPSGSRPDMPAPGTVTVPQGVFGPPPEMPSAPARPAAPISGGTQPSRPASGPYGAEPVRADQDAVPARQAATRDEAKAAAAAATASAMAAAVAAESAEVRNTPTPARGFDAIAEAVLEDVPLAPDGAASALPAGRVARVNEAVRAGRTDVAAELAEETVAEAEATLGPEHPEVLRLRELTAYIAYLAGEPERAVRLSLDVAAIHRRRQDAEAAYGTVQGAYTAWRAVRDPRQGLSLGGELIELWSALAVPGGPAADGAEQLRSARARMDRLTARAADAG